MVNARGKGVLRSACNEPAFDLDFSMNANEIQIVHPHDCFCAMRKRGKNMKRMAGLFGILGMSAAILAAGWSGVGRGEFATPQGDAYFDIRSDSGRAPNSAVGAAHLVVKDENGHPIIGVDLPQGAGQFDTVRHNVMIQGAGAVRDAQGVHRGPVQVQVHDGGPSGTDHVKVTAGPNIWEGDLEEGNIIVAPHR
jgi:hypothetical protein